MGVVKAIICYWRVWQHQKTNEEKHNSLIKNQESVKVKEKVEGLEDKFRIKSCSSKESKHREGKENNRKRKKELRKNDLKSTVEHYKTCHF